jgi:hypothetical protein
MYTEGGVSRYAQPARDLAAGEGQLSTIILILRPLATVKMFTPQDNSEVRAMALTRLRYPRGSCLVARRPHGADDAASIQGEGLIIMMWFRSLKAATGVRRSRSSVGVRETTSFELVSARPGCRPRLPPRRRSQLGCPRL